MTGKDIFKITLNLVVVYLIGGFILAFVYSVASPMIFRNNEKAEQDALKQLIEGADFTKLGDWTIHEKHAKYFEAKKDGQTVGYVVQSFGKGYSSYINTMVAVDRDFKVGKINILGHAETPGLGDEIETDWFKNQFMGKDSDHLKVLKTDTTEYIQAISGATISSRAVAEDAVKNGIAFLVKTVKEGDKADVKHEHN